MNNRRTTVTALLVVPAMLAAFTAVAGQARRGLPPDDPLFRTVAALDTQVFDAFNRCDLDTLGRLFADDLEFYHDIDGLSRSRATFIEAVKNNICGKVTRELIPDTLEVYPMKGGAIEIGVHRFHHPGKDDVEPIGEGQFTHIWQVKDGQWIITRVISYDHHVVNQVDRFEQSSLRPGTSDLHRRASLQSMMAVPPATTAATPLTHIGTTASAIVTLVAKMSRRR
jgi:ketosteroid isomerase-like protein